VDSNNSITLMNSLSKITKSRRIAAVPRNSSH